jgi:pyruvate dehydrogenase E2 component (dihydrolipoyllysine-residue acetyltransferase)
VSWSPSEASTSGAPIGAEPGGVELTVPDLDSGPSATIVSWSKRIGDRVAPDEPICRLAVGEQQFDVHSTAEGRLRRVFATVGARVVSGDSLAEVGVAAAAPPPAEPSPAEPEPFYVTEPPAALAEPELDLEPEQDAEPAPVIAPPAEAVDDHEVRADDGAGPEHAFIWASWHSPVVRKLAEKHGIDLSTVTGTGAGGRIRKRDVLDRI